MKPLGCISLIRRVLYGFLFVSVCLVSPALGQVGGVREFQQFSGAPFPGIQNPASSHYTVVGLRVEFQPDSSRFSTGDGLFDGILFEGAPPPTVDPLPHDSAYFDAHLAFLRNYVRRVSSGRTELTTIVLPEIVRVSKPMGAYAPTGFNAESDAEVSKLAFLVEEVWTLVDADPDMVLPPDLDPEHTAFVLFHAGVGRDIDLLGNILDKTPEDLPSLYFDSAALKRLTGKGTFDVGGFPVSNSMIIPRTETRRATDFFNEDGFLVELSINGMLAASFLNFLGVPDLFNTKSGESGIGPFGVMDGLGIFAYSGLIPPEPSAWTKLFLGWADVKMPDTGEEQLILLEHAGSLSGSDVFVAPVSSAEYFLVENRNRDPEDDGIHMQVYSHGEIREVVFENGAPDFNGQTISGYPGGVVVDVDNFDFVLPGGKDENGERLNGGILIWHIDERRLREGLEDNSVNADSSRRSVSLEEADSGTDIGFPSAGLFGPAFNLGSPFDFYYEGNPFSVITATGQVISLYQNRFGADTHPPSTANGGGPSFVELRDFSVPGPSMQFTYSRISESGIAENLADAVDSGFGEGFNGQDGVLRYIGSPGIDYMGFGVDTLLGGRLFVSLDGEISGELTGLLAARPAVFGGSVFAIDRNGFWEVSADGEIERLTVFPSTLNVVRSTSALVAMDDGSIWVAVETTAGPALLSVDDNGFSFELLSDEVRSLAVVDGLRLALVYRDRAEVRSTSFSWTFDPILDENPFQAFFVRSGRRPSETGISVIVPDVQRRRILLLLKTGQVSVIDLDDYAPYGFTGDLNPYPVVLDIDGDHISEIVVTMGEWLLAFRSNGTLLEPFPIRLRVAARTQPVFGRLSDGGNWTALIAGIDGQIDAYDLDYSNRSVPGFPLSVGAADAASPVLREGTIAGLSADGTLSIWQTERLEEGVWQDAFRPENANFIEIVPALRETVNSRVEIDRFFLLPGDKTYNWPNPVTDGVTRIRVEPGATSDVQITIVNAAGALIDELEMKGIPGGVASEIEWRTDAASGLYIARITATSGSRQETRLIKIAIIR